MLFDCGHNEQTGFRPSEYLVSTGCTGIEKLVIQNYDQDHVSDLPNVISNIPVEVLVRNKSVSASQLQTIKELNGPLTTAMKAAIGMHSSYNQPVTNPPHFPNIEFETFHNPYPHFTDTNNLSLVSFIHYDGMGIIFPGDLEKEGWERLLQNPSFCDHLRRTTIFIASHHGRINGYCAEVFNFCTPEIVIISDKEIVHETQKQRYGQHATGIPWDNGQKRYVLTTRSDKTITIRKQIGQGGRVSTNSL